MEVIEELRLASIVRGAAKPSDEKLSDTSYSVSVDGQVVGDQKYSTLTEAKKLPIPCCLKTRSQWSGMKPRGVCRLL